MTIHTDQDLRALATYLDGLSRYGAIEQQRAARVAADRLGRVRAYVRRLETALGRIEETIGADIGPRERDGTIREHIDWSRRSA